MLFNSFEFFIFFPLITILYYVLPHRYRWSLLLTASCIFYMFFIPAYIFILLLTIVIDYYAALKIASASGKRKKMYLIASIVSTCLVLFVFKYYNFFADNVTGISHLLGWNYSLEALSIILPIGLSFHTFQSLSYVIEVYRGEQQPERHFGIYSLYVMFYPQLVAGPIERPQNLLHQFREYHSFKYENVTNGLKLMAWGLLKKVVIADRLSLFVDQVYNNPYEYHGLAILVATAFFTIQIYCDFSGYSDIAIGAAQCMGFSLMTNFNRPYFSKSIAEFWKRWHISLSTWFKDYVYIPLGGNRKGVSRTYINLAITFLISGFWHGANWTFIMWGGLHSFFLISGLMIRNTQTKVLEGFGIPRNGKFHVFLQIASTTSLVAFAWIYFRAANLEQANYLVSHLFSNLWNDMSAVISNTELRASLLYLKQGRESFLISLSAISILILAELFQRNHSIRLYISNQQWYIRWPLYYGTVAAMLFYGVFNHSQFIYFQF